MKLFKRFLSNNQILSSRQHQHKARRTARPWFETLEDRCLLSGQPALLLTGLPSAVAAGAHLQVTLAALDISGLVNLGFADKVHFTSSDPLAVLPPDYTFTGLDLGVHVFTGDVIFNTPGMQSLSVVDLQVPLLGAVDANINVSPAVVGLKLSTSGSPTAGVGFSLTAAAVDSSGNPVPGYTGTIHITSSDVKSGLNISYTFTNADQGIKTFTNLILDTAGAQTISIQDTGNASIQGGTGSITVAPGAAASMVFSLQPTTSSSGTLMSPQVTIEDAFGNVASSSTAPVSLQLSNASGDESLGGTTTVTPVNGVAVFHNVFVSGFGIGVKLQANSGSITQDSKPFNSIPLSDILPVVVAPVIYGPGSSASQVESYVKGIYQTLLGRDADQAGLSFWVGQINGGASRTAIINSFWNSPENRGREVDAYYETYLGRAAEPQGRAFWIDQLQHGADETAIVDSFLLSPEELHATNQAFVTRLYQGALARGASSSEINYWLGQLDEGVTRQQMTNSFVFSPEAAGVAVDSDYGAYLQRSSDANSRAFWVGQISSQAVSYASVAKALLASDEFFANAAHDVA